MNAYWTAANKGTPHSLHIPYSARRVGTRSIGVVLVGGP